MNILYVAPDVRVERAHGGATHVNGFAQGLKALGHNVFIIARSDKTKVKDIEGITYYFIKESVTPMIKVFSLFFKTFALTKKLIKKHKINLVMERARIFGGPGLLAARQRGVRCLYDLIEPFVKVPYVEGRINKLTYKFLAYWRSKNIKWADKVFITHESMGYGVPKNKLVMAYTGTNPEVFKPSKKKASLMRKYELKGKKIVFFIGMFRQWFALNLIIESAKILVKKDPKAQFLLVGGGTQSERAKAKVKALGLESFVTFTERVPFNEVPDYVNLGDVCLILFDSKLPAFKELGYYFSPIRVFEYMSLGKPVIASDMGTLKTIIKDGYNGYLVPTNPQVIADRLLKILSNPSLKRQMGKRNRELIISKYNWKTIAKSYVDSLL